MTDLHYRNYNTDYIPCCHCQALAGARSGSSRPTAFPMKLEHVRLRECQVSETTVSGYYQVTLKAKHV